ncbi:hypothetical protein [Novosphingobium sp. AP12]|uniref:hypothetical protein n=1 Tax=Novosphingobium sp. AP12 TaxID=1144305 RepID=UPI000271EC59|nr:hypothetical protein [Novosphingobium sp. AP12]EJL31259.1 hypothetical protein PMI02_01780 [Novosphingobium sp. AP12]
MAEATWYETMRSPPINWRMSAALENVPRGDEDVAEVTSLEAAVLAWTLLDPDHRATAILTVEHPVQIDGSATQSFAGEGIASLVERLSARIADS